MKLVQEYPAIFDGVITPPADDGLDFPGFLDRTRRGAPAHKASSSVTREQNITTASPGSK